MKDKCSVCTNRNEEVVVQIEGTYYMCASCVKEDYEDKRSKIYKLERILEFIINGGIG